MSLLKRSIAFLSLIFLIIFAVGCNTVQSIEEKETAELEQILGLISSGKWEEARSNLEKDEFKGIENYKEIFTYVDAKNDYENNKNSGNISYEPIVIKMNSIELDTYQGVLKEEIEEFKVQLNEEKEAFYKKFYAAQMEEGKEKQKKLQQEFYDEMDDLLIEENYDKLTYRLINRIDDDIDSKMLYYFAESQLSRISGDRNMMIEYLESIPSTYNGMYAELIMNEKQKIKPKDKWILAEQNKVINEGKKKSKVPPGIGMTSSEVRDSSWGGPDKINKTTYEFGVHEQWVYSNYRYVYFEDGIVTAIQE